MRELEQAVERTIRAIGGGERERAEWLETWRWLNRVSLERKPWRDIMHPNWQELADYLEERGETFDPQRAGGWDKLVEDEFAGFRDPLDFYKRGKQYLYHLTAFDLDIWKTPYRNAVLEQVRPCQVLDYGCGIGSDGLWLAARGFAPAFADFDSECTKYLRWRVERRGEGWPVYDIEKDDIPRHDLVVAFDVVEHVEPPGQEPLLRELARLGRKVAVNLRAGGGEWDGKPALHYPVDVGALRGVAEEIAGGAVVHRIFNVYQHFVLFGTPEPKAGRKPRPTKAKTESGAEEETL